MNIEIKISKRRISYKKAMKILDKRVDRIKTKRQRVNMAFRTSNYLYAGIRTNNEEILDKKIKVINTNRGGKITLHNPGQK